MSRWLDLKVLGDKALDERLDQLDKGTAMKAVRPALRAGMKSILPGIKAGVPVATGKLAGAKWTIRAAKRKRGRVGVAILSPTREALGIAADDPYYYPAAAELGREGQAAHSFMRTGLHAGEATAMQQVATVLWERLERLGAGRAPADDTDGDT